ncbi:Transcription initiation factor TFIIB [uncultured virus]|nr:Transcription initiation factor TFIIB [uncultured virus]
MNTNIDFNNFDEIKMNDDDLFEILDQMIFDERNKNQDNNKNGTLYCEHCMTCDTIVKDFAQGIMVCKECGNIVENVLDENPEWKQYNGEDSKNDSGRCNFPTNHFLPQSSLGTSIGGTNRSKIKTLHNWSAMPYKERSLHTVLKEIQSRCRKYFILKCIEDDAKILYKNISECKHLIGKNKGKNIIIRGVNRRGLIAACVFYACLRKGQTRSPKEIADIFELKYTDITKGCKTFIKLMKIKNMEYEFNSSLPEHFIKRFCKELHIKNEYVDQAVKLAKNIQRLNIASVHTPLSVATGSIILMADLNGLQLSKKLLSKQFPVSEVTIMKAYKKLESYKDILINDQLVNKLVETLEQERAMIKMPKSLQDKYNIITNLNNPFLDAEMKYTFNFKTDSLDDYVNFVNLDLYKKINEIDKIYNHLVSE